ncbi:hypothetical protein S7711_03201 [Stachybotrys chartarum IBT 7711]|uniref:2EXR domain-containing protein n=1 Tax=Stachybotrys chartarum (strain CBS 109288 / IBT 7711) TaxID=1280523 RepID=A0A084AWN7_STACB|nr:hypothetical protein S7711_03201 [Stachybotrys chartarum IBT 7711]KFA49308.1 hypothetical protein S40293_04144 [Stachybotrys chartarum IBT 40293]KFA80453.1 hypothetical protein S40288_02041 [Stachybotrys chartarum IBT 40288]
MEAPIKFSVPEQCRSFTLFSSLPPEIRHQIWSLTLANPGIQFLKLETRGRSWRWAGWRAAGAQMPGLHQHSGPGHGADNNGGISTNPEIGNEPVPRRVWDTRLVPLSPTPMAELSHYPILDRQIKTLLSTCTESAAVVKRLMSRPGNLRLENGHVASLEKSQDVVYLEYFHPNVFNSGCSFGATTNCDALKNIRRVVLRFSHEWQAKKAPKACLSCGRIHHAPNGVVYPVHIYQFLARHLPNLEDFYFVDYFIQRRRPLKDAKPSEMHTSHVQQCFRAKNRTFFEAEAEQWIIKPCVFEMQSWLQDQFVQYAKSSKLSRHKHPEKVNFGLLACEWDIQVPPEQRRMCAMLNGIGNKRATRMTRAIRQKQPPPTKSPKCPEHQWIPETTSNLPVVFGRGQYTPFTFECHHET